MVDHFIRTHLRVGSILGIPVGLNASWFVVFAIVLWTLWTGYLPQVAPDAAGAAIGGCAVVAALLFFASILAHELGHALVARACGIEVRGITLFILGGVSRIDCEPRTALEELLVASAGPLVSAALAIFGWAAAAAVPDIALVDAVIAYLVVVNAALALFNVVPALPLDGGRMLRAILWAASGDVRRATRGAAFAGRACGGLLVGAGVVAMAIGGWVFGFWLLAIGIFVERSAAASARAALTEAGDDLSIESEAAVAGDAEFERKMRRVIAWRARLDALPMEGEVLAEAADEERDEPEGADVDGGSGFIEARDRMIGLLNRIDAEIRARLDPVRIEETFGRLTALYEEWIAPPEEGIDDPPRPEDSLAAGRPSGLAPTPDEVLHREPGSSTEV